MAPTSNVPTSVGVDHMLSFLNRNLQNLHVKYNLLLQKEKSLNRKGRGLFWIKERQKIQRSKCSVGSKIDMLEKALKEFSSAELSLSPQLVTAIAKEVHAADPSTSSAKRGRGVASGQLQTLKSRRLADMTCALCTSAQQNESVGLYKEELESSINEIETKVPRYVLVSNGYMIYCLDLQQSKGESINYDDCHLPPLPKIATLNLMEKGLPMSVGLFKLGSDAYMIGGQEQHTLPLTEEVVEDWDCLYNNGKGGKTPTGYNLYRALCSGNDVKGTSRVTFHLSLTDEGTLSHSKCHTIKNLQKPKFWPIVEKIKGQIHVIDSVPNQFAYHDTRDWIFSHETLNHVGRHRCTWMKIPTPNEQIFIASHLVVGDCIYGVDGGGEFVLFDSKANEWKVYRGRDWWDPLSARKVWHIIRVGIARCAGKFPLRGGGEASDSDPDPLYVVIALVRSPWWISYGKATYAVAYLVTSTGEVVCYQRLRRFFKKSVKPWCMGVGTMLDVDEEGKTLCAIFKASAIFNGEDVDSGNLFINIFDVEMLSEAAMKVLDIHAKGRKAWPVEQEFVRVDMKQRCMFKTEGDFLAVQACFI